MFLYINTSNHQEMILALIDKQGVVLKIKKVKAVYQQSEKLLTSIEKVVGIGRDLSELKGIIVVTGPGGFTSLRIGIATANAMAWALNIPVVGIKNDKNLDDEKLINIGFNKVIKIKKFKQVLPAYGKEPNITKKD